LDILLLLVVLEVVTIRTGTLVVVQVDSAQLSQQQVVVVR
jgi:hypothetical protein